MVKMRCLWRVADKKPKRRLLTVCVLGALMLMTAMGCPDEDGGGGNDSSKAGADGGIVETADCIVMEGDCPNSCIGGTGILGETCGGTKDCMCGLFCNAGICSPYEGQYESCTCQGEIPDFGGDPTPTCADLEDGESCDDGDACTVLDACSGGECIGAVKDCSGLDVICQTVGVCDAATGECEAQSVPEDASCDDGDACTLEDSCQDGQCVGGAAVEACSCTGLADGVGCDDQDPCTEGDACSNEVCMGAAKDCSALDGPCQTGTCAAESGACTFTLHADGSECEDGNLCTLGDQCLDGACVYSDLKDCGQDCRSGLCAPETGTCDGPVLEDGTLCEDGDTCTNNACIEGVCTVTQNECECVGQEDGTNCSDGDTCTENDRCLNEVCIGDELICEGSADGCLLGQCNRATGTCETVPADFGTLCNDGDACTLDDYCSEGFCQGQAKDCNAEALACQAGTCNSATGNCDMVAMPDGLLCEVADSCVSAATCQTGVCTAIEGATRCGVCDELELNAACDDGSTCTTNDKCILNDAGDKVCLGQATNCTDSSSECSLGGCDIADGSCRNFDVPVGGSCFDNDACTENDICTADGCAGTPYFVCGTQPTQCEVFAAIGTPATAMLIDVNVSDALVRGRIDNVGEADWYAMNLHEGDIISVSTHGNCGTEIDTFVQLLDGAILEQENDMQRAILAYNDNNGSSIWSKIENYTIQADGKYYVEVQTHGSSQDLSYLLAIDRVGPTFCQETSDCACEQLTCQAVGDNSICRPTFDGEVEPNDNTNTNNPLTFGETVAGRLSNYEDEDRYSVELSTNEPVFIETHALCGEVTDTIIKVFDPAGTLVAVNDNTGLAKIQHFLPRVSGTYEVEVLGRNSAVGPYLLTTGANTCEVDDFCSALCDSLGCVDGNCGPANPEVEDNDSLSGAGRLLWDVSQYGNFGKTNDRDLRFAWMQAGVYSFETAPFCGQASDTILAIYKLRPDNNTSLLATNDNGGEGLHSKVSNIELAALTPVLVEVSAFGSSVGDYVLTTTGTEPVQATQTLGEILGANADLSFALQAFEVAGLLDLVNGPGVRTFYVPTNAAFASLAALRGLENVDALLTELDLSRILKHHVVEGALHTPILDGQREVINMIEEGVLLRPQGDGWTYGGATLSGDSMLATNGVVQILDNAVNPPPDPMASCDTAGLECVSNSTCTDSSGMAQCVCDAGYAGVYCDPVVCAADEYVSDHTCQPCAPGTTHPANTPAPGENTACENIICAENENVVNHACQPCDTSTPNEPGDDASGEDTACDTPICGENEYVLAHECLPCAPGTTNAAGDIITRDDTTCDITYCGENERVENYACIACDRHFVNAAGDDASFEAYSFTKTLGMDIYNPDILAQSPDGSLWVTDWYDHKLWRIAPDDTATEYPEAGAYEIMAIDFNSDGSKVFFIDSYENQIVSMNADGSELTQINLSFGYVNDIALYGDNLLYILDAGDNKLFEMDLTNNTLRRIAQDLLDYPSRIDMGTDGSLFVLDQGALNKINLEEMTLETIQDDFEHYNYFMTSDGDFYYNVYPDDQDDEENMGEDTGPQVVRVKPNGETLVVSSGRAAHYISVLAGGHVAITYYDGYGVSVYGFGAINTYCEPKTHCEEDEFTLYTTCEYCPPGTTNPAGEPIDESEAEDTDGGVVTDERGCEVVVCDFDERVTDNACETCPPGSTNAAGDDASGITFTRSILTDDNLTMPLAVASNAVGDVYVATYDTIYQVDENSALTAVATDLEGVTDVVASDDGALYVAKEYAGTVTRMTFGENASSKSLDFGAPRALAIGADGSLFVAEVDMQEIHKLEPSAFEEDDEGDGGVDDMYEQPQQIVGVNISASALAVGIDGAVYAMNYSGQIFVMKAHTERYHHEGYDYGYGANEVEEYTWYEDAIEIEHDITGLDGTLAVDAFGQIYVTHTNEASEVLLTRVSADGAAVTTIQTSTSLYTTDLKRANTGTFLMLSSVESYDVLSGRACAVGGAGDAGPAVGVTSMAVSDEDVGNYMTTDACKAFCNADETCLFVQNQIEGVTLEEYNQLKAENGEDFGCLLFTQCLDENGVGETGYSDERSMVFKKIDDAVLQGRTSLLEELTRVSLDTSCDPTLCLENYYVENHTCVPCGPGASNAADDEATGADTSCEPILCDVDQRVEMNTCVACPAGQENEAGDDATNENTTCEDTICNENHFVSSNVCTPCAPGTTRPAGDNATGTDTSCEETICVLNQAVINHTCVDCPTGWQRSSLDNAANADTHCEEIICGDTEYVDNFQCLTCEPGYGSEMVGNAAMTNFASTALVESGMQSPQGLAVDNQGHVYAADMAGNQVKKIDVEGNMTDIGAGYDGPMAVAIGANGDVYVADAGNGKIKKVSENGEITESIQTFIWPVDVAVGPFGDIFVVDADALHVYILPANAFQTTGATTDGNATAETVSIDSVSTPSSVTVSPQNVLFIGDDSSHEIHRFVQNAYGVWGLEAGANSNMFEGIQDLESDAFGNVYVLQTVNAVSGSQSDSTTSTITNCEYCNQEYFAVDLDPGHISEINWSVSIKDQGHSSCATYAYVRLLFVKANGTETALGTARNSSTYCDGDRQNYETVYRTWSQGDGNPLLAESGDRLVMEAISSFQAWEVNVNAGDLQVTFTAPESYVVKINHSGFSENILGPIATAGGLALVNATSFYVSLPEATTVLAVTGTSASTTCTGITCGLDEYVLENACTACPAGTTNAEGGDDATGEDTSCTATLCETNQYVLNHVCEYCPEGTQRDAGDDASGENTSCDPWLCAENERVTDFHTCEPCPRGMLNAAGDDASAEATECDYQFCAVNEQVVNNTCVACPPGTSTNQQSDASQTDTVCEIDYCNANEYASNHTCVPCADGETSNGADPSALTYTESVVLDTGLASPQGLAVAADGTLYIADTNNAAVKKRAPDGTVSELGSGFIWPKGIDVNDVGEVFVADFGAGEIKKIGTDNNVTTLMAGLGAPSTLESDGLQDVAVGPEGHVYATYKEENTAWILKMTDQGRDGFGELCSIESENCVISWNTLDPKGIDVTVDGTVYVADHGNDVSVTKLTPSSGGMYTNSSVASESFGATGLQVNANGVVFVNDNWSSTIKQISLFGMVSEVPNANWNENYPQLRGLALAANGDLYVTKVSWEGESQTSSIVKLTSSPNNTSCSGAEFAFYEDEFSVPYQSENKIYLFDTAENIPDLWYLIDFENSTIPVVTQIEHDPENQSSGYTSKRYLAIAVFQPGTTPGTANEWQSEFHIANTASSGGTNGDGFPQAEPGYISSERNIFYSYVTLSMGGLDFYAHTEMYVYTNLGESLYISDPQSGMTSTEASSAYHFNYIYP